MIHMTKIIRNNASHGKRPLGQPPKRWQHKQYKETGIVQTVRLLKDEEENNYSKKCS